MYNWKELLDYINGEIAGMSFERQPAELYAPIRYVLSMGGKRIRPVLMLMAYNLYKEKVEVIGSQAMADVNVGLSSLKFLLSHLK